MKFKEKIKQDILFGSFVTFGLADIAEYTALLGFDFIVIDNEHGILNQSTILDMVRAAQCQGVPAIVRCTHDNVENIHKALDMGAEGILIPVINTAEDARNIVKASLYAPQGDRGIAFFTRAARYGMIGDKNLYLKKSNEESFISIQVETAQSIKNLDEILSIEEIDMFFIGPNDLAASMGYSNSDPKVLETIKETIEKINKVGKIAGIFVNNSEEAKRAIEWGAKFILTSITPYMTRGAKKYLEEVRN